MVTTTTLKFLASLIIITAMMPAWQYNVGIRLIAYNLLGVLFIACTIFYHLVNVKFTLKMAKPVKQLLILLTVFYCVKLFSIIGLYTYFSQHPQLIDEAIIQFLLGIVMELYTLVLFICLASLFCRLSQKGRHDLILVFVFSIFCSCLYQYLSLYYLLNKGIDLDSIIWPFLSYGLQENYTTLATQAIGNTDEMFFRAGGFAINPNALAAQLVTITPFLILHAIYRNKKFLFLTVIVIVSMIFTMSRSGLLALGIGLVLLCFMEYKALLKKFKIPIILLSVTLVGLAIVFGEFFIDIIAVRFSGGAGHRNSLNGISFEIWSQSPLFGTGYNASSAAVLSYTELIGETGTNLHNFWLIKAVELGVFGLMTYIFLHVYIIYAVSRDLNVYAKSFICSIVGLTVAGLFNNAMSGFPLQLFVLLFFCTSILFKQGIYRSNILLFQDNKS